MTNGNGVKSKEFGCFWKSMFLVSLCFPRVIDKNNPEHLQKIKHFKMYYNSFQYVLPCKFCKIFTQEVLMKKYPLNYSGRIELMKSLYVWKNIVSDKLRNQGNPIKKNPDFEVIRKKYEKLYAVCDSKLGKCV
jgi:hypothetical protein